MCACILLEGVFVVVQITYNPVSDQEYIISIAREWASGNWSLSLVEGYLKQYPFQCGIVLVLYILFKMFGEATIIAFKVLNVFSVIVIYYLFYKLSYKKVAALNIIFGILFLPPILYCSYVYGNALGSALILFGFLMWKKYEIAYENKYLVYMILICMLSVFVKGTNIIPVTAIIIYQFIGFLNSKQIKNIVAIIVLVMTTLLANKSAPLIAETITGEQLGEGSYQKSWIVMGMMEQDERRYDGWWNGYNTETWAESDGNIEAQRNRVDKDLQERIDFFASDPKYAVEFFAKKNASEWNNPTFESFWINTFMGRYNEGAKTWLENQLVEPTMKNVAEYLNIIQSLILGFALIAILFGNDKTQIWYVLTLIGGFLFFTFWEAQSSNTLWLFVMLIPLASNGIGVSTYLLGEVLNRNYNAILKRKYTLLIVMICIVFIGVSKSATIGRIFKGTEDEDEYNGYLQYMSELTEDERNQVYHDFP